MKLQRHFAYKYKDKEHYKNVIVLPEEIINKLGWGPGLELEESTNGDALVLKPTTATSKERPRLSRADANRPRRGR